jgi:hypothetical protein
MNNLKHGLYSKQVVYPERCDRSSRRAQVGALLARKHNLKQHRANEVAALLFTRLFERAENIAAGRTKSGSPRPRTG